MHAVTICMYKIERGVSKMESRRSDEQGRKEIGAMETTQERERKWEGK